MANVQAATEHTTLDEQRVLEIIEQAIENFRTILDHVEGVVHEVMKLVQLLKELFRDVKALFTSDSYVTEDGEYQSA